jgi:uncharacterized protein YcfJ
MISSVLVKFHSRILITVKYCSEEKMKTQCTILLKYSLAASLTAIIAAPSVADSYVDYARVTHVSPIYETISVREPHRECHLEERAVRHYKQSSSATPTIVGALIGGAIGNKLGHNKSNKRVGAVAGAILGGSIASDLNRNNRHHEHRTRTEKVCHTSYTTRHDKQITGYDVNYQYRGREYSTIMSSHPDKRIQVAVDVSPIDY